MTDLVERYVHQVGRYLPPKERADIEAELRSQIQDQLDDRYASSPSQADIASVLSEFGHPYQMATSYTSEQYLVGPVLYPYMILVLRQGWLIVPAIVIFLNIFGALVSSPQDHFPSLVIETTVATVEATLIFSAAVVLFFALLQHSYLKIDVKEDSFNPLDLPEVNDPRTVDRFEAITGIVMGVVMMLVLLYFARVGGLTLRFNLGDPGEVIAVPINWLLLLIMVIFAMVLLHVVVLRRNRWGVGMWLVETLLEVFGAICLYFVVYAPVVDRILLSNPSLANVPLVERIPEILVVIGAVTTLVTRGSRLVKLWNYRNSRSMPLAIKTDS